MCDKDKAVSLQLLVILTICIGCLLVHYVAEDLAPFVYASGLGFAGHGGWLHLICENCDEHFIFPSPTGISAEHPIIQPGILVLMDVTSFAIPPCRLHRIHNLKRAATFNTARPTCD